MTAEEAQRYARHFALPQIGVEGQKKLGKASVLVIGAGGLGSAAIAYLAAAGVGRLGIADFDRIELSNLQRQILHKTAAIGQSKAESAAEFVKGLNPRINVVCHDVKVDFQNVVSLVSDYDFVLDCTDGFGNKFLINDGCALAKKPFSHAGAVGFTGQAFTYVPGRGACLRCILGSVPSGGESCSSAGVLGAAVGVMGCIQAAEAVKYIVGAGDLLVGRVLVFDGLKMLFRQVKVARDPNCAVCGKNAGEFSLEKNAADYLRGCK